MSSVRVERHACRVVCVSSRVPGEPEAFAANLGAFFPTDRNSGKRCQTHLALPGLGTFHELESPLHRRKVARKRRGIGDRCRTLSGSLRAIGATLRLGILGTASTGNDLERRRRGMTLERCVFSRVLKLPGAFDA